MSRITNNQIMEQLTAMNNMMQSIMNEQKSQRADITALQEQISARKSSSAKKQSATPEMQPYTKADGTVVMATAKQIAAWDAWKSREHMSLDEVKALKPEITKAGRAYVKAHPNCTRKEAAANGCKNITKEGLKALKVELGVRVAK